MSMSGTIFSCYERDSFLRHFNPALKLALALFFMLIATILFDVRPLLLIFSAVFLTTWSFGKVPLKILLKGLLPFLLLGCGYLWMNALFPRTGQTLPTILFQIGPFKVVQEGVITGVVMIARALCFGICSLLFISTTDPTEFILSLVQQLGLDPRIAYGTLAAYRFLPLLENELRQIRNAHRLRGVGTGEGLRGKLSQVYRYTIPLLASAIRKAGRVAIAMESRAFTGERERTYYRRLKISRAEWSFAAGALIVLGGILLLSRNLGWLHLWSGNLGF